MAKYRITREGVDQVQNYNACVTDLLDFIPDNMDKVNAINEILDSSDIPEKILEEMVGKLERDQIFEPSPREIDANAVWPYHFDAALLEFDDEDYEIPPADLALLFDKGFLEKAEVEPSWLDLIALHLHKGEDLFRALAIITAFEEVEEEEEFYQEISNSEYLSFDQKMLITHIAKTFGFRGDNLAMIDSTEQIIKSKSQV